MELHKIQVLHGKACLTGHGAAILGAGVRRSARLIGMAKSTVCMSVAMSVGMSSDTVDGATFHAHSIATWTLAVILHDQVHGKVLDGE